MMPTDSFAAVFLFSFSMAIGAVMTPGPITTTIISQAPRIGWKSGFLLSVGHAIMEFTMVVLITVGLSEVLGSPTAQTIIAILGGMLLLYMAISMFIDVFKGKMIIPEKQEDVENLSPLRLVLLGIITSISNPFWYAWWMTAAAAFLLQAKVAGWVLVAGFFFGHISADFLWNLLLASVIGGGKKFLNNKTYAALIGFCAAFLIYLAVSFIIAGYKGIVG